MKKKTCYMCDKEAVSSEHVPPKCLFPKAKDSGGIDYRKNLLTVPSCDLHNSQKSTDDEYLLLVLNANHFASGPANINRHGKLPRMMDHKPESVIRMLGQFSYVEHQNKGHGAFRLDQERFLSCVSHIANALYYHHKGHRSNDVETDVVKGFLFQDSKRTINAIRISRITSEIESQNEVKVTDWLGENPEVFKYKMIEYKNGVIFRTIFYCGVECISIHT